MSTDGINISIHGIDETVVAGAPTFGNLADNRHLISHPRPREILSKPRRNTLKLPLNAKGREGANVIATILAR
jgi:hypothetical protein